MGSASMGNHALIFGASGISGWAITNQILHDYPTQGTFAKVTALTNRPLPAEYAMWSRDARLNVVSGIDLMKGSQSDLESVMREKISDIESVTQVFYYSYKFDADPNKEAEINMSMLDRSVRAVESLSSELSYVVLPTGTKAYGVHLLDKFPFANDLPCSEKLPRIPEPYASEMFYYHETDALAKLAEGKPWKWCEIRPDVVVGYVPNNNVYCLAQTMSIYLSMYKSIEGEGAECPFPGTEKSWKILSNDSSQDIVARFSIYASLHPEKTGGRAFNVADNDKASSWAQRWPVICAWFGLEGTGPREGAPQPPAYIGQHMEKWQELVKKHGLKKGVMDVELDGGKGGYQYFIMTLFDFDRHLDLSAMREVGFTDQVLGDKCWATAFDRFRAGKAIP